MKRAWREQQKSSGCLSGDRYLGPAYARHITIGCDLDDGLMTGSRTLEAMSRISLNHRLIMFIGPSGAGKSTMSSGLHRQLAGRGLSVSLLSEDEVYRLDALQVFVEEWQRSAPGGIGTLLQAVRTLRAQWQHSETVWITDAFLPAFHWLQGKYASEQVEAYADDLARILRPLESLLVYLEADVNAAWHRAVAQRGQGWSEWMVTLFTSREFPSYPGGPFQDVDDLLRFFVWIERQSRARLARWPGDKLILQTAAASQDQLMDALLHHLGLKDLPHSSDAQL